MTVPFEGLALGALRVASPRRTGKPRIDLGHAVRAVAARSVVSLTTPAPPPAHVRIRQLKRMCSSYYPATGQLLVHRECGVSDSLSESVTERPDEVPGRSSRCSLACLVGFRRR